MPSHVGPDVDGLACFLRRPTVYDWHAWVQCSQIDGALSHRVADKMHKQPTAHTEQAQHHTSKILIKIKRSNDANLLQTLGKIPNEYGCRRWSGCLLLAHPLLQVLRRWLTKCRCQMRRGHWLH
jgi:hypothetical protein